MHDSIRLADQDSENATPARVDWPAVERAMERWRDLRAAFFHEFFSAAFRNLGRRSRAPKAGAVPGRTPIAVRAVLVAALAAAGALVLTAATGRAEQARDMASAAERETSDTDRALLAGLGLEPGAIERCEDAALLWRAVRELVLTQRVSEPMQQRILRRVWLVDPAVRAGSVVDSDVN